MDFYRERANNQPIHQEAAMSPMLCPRGSELFAVASHADEAFKTKLVEFFSTTSRDDNEMMKIEMLGARHREADEIFQRHKRFCETCAGAPTEVSRHVALK